MVECARLESVYAARYQGFESLTLRKLKQPHLREVVLVYVKVCKGFESRRRCALVRRRGRVGALIEQRAERGSEA